jgi:hypothetical protein
MLRLWFLWFLQDDAIVCAVGRVECDQMYAGMVGFHAEALDELIC